MIPKLNLDGTLKKRISSIQERLSEEGQPGLYSPRQATQLHSSIKDAQPGPNDSSPTSPSATRRSSHDGGDTAVSSSSIHMPFSPSSPPSHEGVIGLGEDAAIGISDPEMRTILAFKSRHPSGDRSPSFDRANSSIGSFSGSGRRSAALATLVDHQQARESAVSEATLGGMDGNWDTKPSGADESSARQSPILPESALASGQSSRHPTAGATTERTSRSLSSLGRQRATASTAPKMPKTSPPAVISVMTTEEAYISGKSFKDYMSGVATRNSFNDGTTSAGTVAAAAHITTTFHQNPSQYISALTTQGDYVAVGDRTGRITVMKRRSMSTAQHRYIVENIRQCDEAEAESFRLPDSRGVAKATRPRMSAPPRSRDPLDFYVAQQAYVPVIDTLNSVEVSPSVTALAFLPMASPTVYLLSSNEKVPKLYKMMSVRESANSFRAVDKISTKTIGPLTASSRTSTVAMKPVASYALNHEYNINSIYPMPDSEQFATADDAAVLLWCTEYPDTSIETYSLQTSGEDGPGETIRCLRGFPHEPFLLFIATSAGRVLVMDTRQSLRWMDQVPQAFSNPPREADEPFSGVTNSLSDCALSPCGRYIVGRDFMSVCLWDVRMAGKQMPSSSGNTKWPSPTTRGESNRSCGVVQLWSLHPHLRDDLETLYQSDLLFERFDVQFLSSKQVCTGGFANSLFTVNIDADSSKVSDGGSAVRSFQLPKTEGISTFRRTTVSSHKPSVSRDASNSLGLGSRMTLMSRPFTSMNGSCGMMAACGQVVLQLSYDGLWK